MPLLSLQGAELAFGLHPLLDRADFRRRRGERIGLIGRNGTGKSSLLNVIAGRLDLDDGEMKRPRGLARRAGRAGAELPPASSLRESLALRGGLTEDNELFTTSASAGAWRRGWSSTCTASASTKRRRPRRRRAARRSARRSPWRWRSPGSAIARRADQPPRPRRHHAARGPDAQAAGSIVITHDRTFLDRVATRIVELDRGLLRSYPATSPRTRRARPTSSRPKRGQPQVRHVLEAGGGVDPQGVEARRTRDMGRVRRLEALRRERAARRERLGRSRWRSTPASAPASSSPKLEAWQAFRRAHAGARSRPARDARRPDRR
jgi:ATP-binding cassette subfamily F protein uup